MDNSLDLSRYLVVDSMELGPVTVTPNSARIACRLLIDGQEHLSSWGYRFTEAVFDVNSEADRNLAAMMTVQTAMNYGLFCRQIVFADRFDEADRQFISWAMESTSREILVKKLHEDNPFLLPGWQLPQILPQSRYTQAKLIFRCEEPGTPTEDWNPRHNTYCVLSSGGKESLLSYGLLREMACETHPIYINESGRHWFTALNAYRRFQLDDAQTARVWTDCDRFFNWMLRRLRFIRSDFQRMRSDDYPLRLWTVAVFLFGALPLLRKRGLSGLVVGNEFDTSRYLDQAVLPHYDGLFDQSVWFDHALSDYFGKKRWSVRVCSILRNLSETLVETVLSARYPELFSLQVSCHAALKSGDRVKPCGRCEKCRRIMTILRAIDVDPGRLGYTEAMTVAARHSLREKGLHSQLAGEFAQVLKLLNGSSEPQEIEHLRIHEQTASASEIPRDIREELFRILEGYSRGIMVWRRNEWTRVSGAGPEHDKP